MTKRSYQCFDICHIDLPSNSFFMCNIVPSQLHQYVSSRVKLQKRRLGDAE